MKINVIMILNQKMKFQFQSLFLIQFKLFPAQRNIHNIPYCQWIWNYFQKKQQQNCKGVFFSVLRAAIIYRAGMWTTNKLKSLNCLSLFIFLYVFNFLLYYVSNSLFSPTSLTLFSHKFTPSIVTLVHSNRREKLRLVFSVSCIVTTNWMVGVAGITSFLINNL